MTLEPTTPEQADANLADSRPHVEYLHTVAQSIINGGARIKGMGFAMTFEPPTEEEAEAGLTQLPPYICWFGGRMSYAREILFVMAEDFTRVATMQERARKETAVPLEQYEPPSESASWGENSA